MIKILKGVFRIRATTLRHKMRPKGVWLARKKAWVAVLKRRKRMLRRKILIETEKVILLRKLSESISKIGMVAKVRVRVVKISGFLLILMMSPWLNIGRGKEIPCKNRRIDLILRRVGILTMEMMVNMGLSLIWVIMPKEG